MAELVPVVRDLALRARSNGIALTVDAEEAARLMLQLDVFAAVLADEQLVGWDGFGLALQVYLKRGWPAIEWLAELARSTGHRIPIRLVKGAYWDTEIKLAQLDGHEDYPVFTRKPNTDLSYLACAGRVLELRDEFYPQFATHNAHTICAINQLAGDRSDFEYQRLHGMGHDRYQEVLDSGDFNGYCRVYAPVGDHRDLLPYLVRRLLENGANSSFVNRIVDEKLPAREVVSDPVEVVERFERYSHPKIPLPADIFAGQRRNSRGINFASESEQTELAGQMAEFRERRWKAVPIGGDGLASGETVEARSPANRGDAVGSVTVADPAAAKAAVENARRAQPDWDSTPADQRAGCLEQVGHSLEASGALIRRCRVPVGLGTSRILHCGLCSCWIGDRHGSDRVAAIGRGARFDGRAARQAISADGRGFPPSLAKLGHLSGQFGLLRLGCKIDAARIASLAGEDIRRQRNFRVRVPLEPLDHFDRIGNHFPRRQLFIDDPVDERAVRTVFQQPAHQVRQQIAVIADRCVDPAVTVEVAAVEHLLIEVVAHAVQTLVLEVTTIAGQLVDGADGVRVVRGKLRVKLVPKFQYASCAGEVGQVGIRLAREHRVVFMAVELGQFDLGIPVRTLDQPDRNPVTGASRQFGQPLDRRPAAFQVNLQRQTESVPTDQLFVGEHSCEYVELKHQARGLLGVDGQRDAGVPCPHRQIAQHRHQLGHHALALGGFVARVQRRKLH